MRSLLISDKGGRPWNRLAELAWITSKHIFQIHGVNTAEEPVLAKKLRRTEMVVVLKKLPPTVIAIEACGGSHHWARLLQSFGHEVKLIAPQFVKPYVKRGKNDAADAEALCEAMSRPAMRFVPVKTLENQAALMLVGLRDRLIRNRVQLANAIRGYAAEFGLTAAKGMCKIEPLLDRAGSDQGRPERSPSWRAGTGFTRTRSTPGRSSCWTERRASSKAAAQHRRTRWARRRYRQIGQLKVENDFLSRKLGNEPGGTARSGRARSPGTAG